MIAAAFATDAAKGAGAGKERSGVSAGDAPPPLASEPTPHGEQMLVPGVTPISLRERLEQLTQAPLMPRKLQKPLDVGLFDLAARNQLDLF